MVILPETKKMWCLVEPHPRHPLKLSGVFADVLVRWIMGINVPILVFDKRSQSTVGTGIGLFTNSLVIGGFKGMLLNSESVI